jgi:hypothetical protein
MTCGWPAPRRASGWFDLPDALWQDLREMGGGNPRRREKSEARRVWLRLHVRHPVDRASERLAPARSNER